MKIFLTGATGFIGRHLILRLLREGHEITVWVRNPVKAARALGNEVEIQGGADQYRLPANALNNCDAVINLAGEPIAGGRWTTSRKQKIIKSRVKTTQALVQACNTSKHPPHVFISASAIGIYGAAKENTLLDETAPGGKDFLADVCKQWEAPVNEITSSTRTIIARIGLVLGQQEGLLQKLTPVFDVGLGGVIGSGQQMMSWIHITDLVEAFTTLLTNKNYQGPVNMVSPKAVSHKIFCKTLATTLNRPCLFGVPSIALKLALGQAAEMILTGNHAIPGQLEKNGFQFNFPTLDAALENIFGKKNTVFIEKTSLHEGATPRLITSTFVPYPFEKVRPFFFTPKSLVLLSPPVSQMELLYGYEENMRQGQEMAFQIKMGPIPQTWIANIDEHHPEYFVDTQTKGPMRYWHHKHSFIAHETGTELKDEVHFTMPLGFLGKLALKIFAKVMLRRLFLYRNHMLHLRFGETTQEDLE
jgi:uncharacterized protein